MAEKELWQTVIKMIEGQEVSVPDMQKGTLFLYGLYVGVSMLNGDLKEEKEAQQKEYAEKLLRYEGTFKEIDVLYAKVKDLEERLEYWRDCAMEDTNE